MENDRIPIASVVRRAGRRFLAIRVVARARDRVQLRTRIRAAIRRWRSRGAGLSHFALAERDVLQPSTPPSPAETQDTTASFGGAASKTWGALELPARGSAVPPEGILVSGWAYAESGPMGEVEVFVDGCSRGLARIGIQREDIERMGRSSSALLSGFELLVDAPPPSPQSPPPPKSGRRVTILVIARPRHGSSFVVAEESFAALHRELPGDANSAKSVARSDRYPPVAAPSHLSLLVVTHDLNLGGAQLWLLELLRHSGAGRDFPCVVRADTDGPMRAALEDLEISVEISGRPPLKRWTDYETETQRLAQRIHDGKFSAVLLNTFGTFIGADAASKLGVPTIWAIHESWPPPMFWIAAYGPDGIDPRIQESALSALAACPAVVFEAEATRSLYVPWTKPGAAVVVPYGVDVDAASRYCAATSPLSARAKLSLPPDGRVLLSMGTIERRKGQTLLAQAFAEVAERHSDAYVAFVGDTHSPYSSALRRFLADAGLKERARVFPVTADIFSWYRASDVLICASDIESLPRSVLDAMSFGTTILATSVFGLPELLTDGESGYLYKANSLPAAVDALDRILSLAPDTVKRVGTAGQALVQSHHRSEGYGQAVRRLLDRFLTEPTALAGATLDPTTF